MNQSLGYFSVNEQMLGKKLNPVVGRVSKFRQNGPCVLADISKTAHDRILFYFILFFLQKMKLL